MTCWILCTYILSISILCASLLFFYHVLRGQHLTPYFSIPITSNALHFSIYIECRHFNKESIINVISGRLFEKLIIMETMEWMESIINVTSGQLMQKLIIMERLPWTPFMRIKKFPLTDNYTTPTTVEGGGLQSIP